MLSHCIRVGMTFVNCKLNGKLTEVMRKGVFLLAISYALLVSCSSAVSLADNYAEDENYYDPTLPSPQFARTSLTLPQSYSEEELDDIWTNSTEVVAPENSSQGSIWWNNTPLQAGPIQVSTLSIVLVAHTPSLAAWGLCLTHGRLGTTLLG